MQLSHIKILRRRKYAGLIKSLDDNVGRILECLDEQGLTENTLLVFTNDNGGQTQTGASNFPLRGGKGTLWEGGIRVPLAIRWPQRIAAGQVVDDPVISLDLLPTFMAAARGTVNPAWNLDGISLMDRLDGNVESLPERTLFWRRSALDIAARRGAWKMIHRRSEPGAVPQLFGLDQDPGETTDRASEHPAILQDLVDAAAQWESQLARPLWGPNRGPDPAPPPDRN